MCLSVKEKRVITSPGTMTTTKQRLYRYRLRKRLDNLAKDITFLHDHRQELSNIGINLDECLPSLDKFTQSDEHTDTSNADTDVTYDNPTDNSVEQETNNRLTRSYLLD